jgi:hypothetical protein
MQNSHIALLIGAVVVIGGGYFLYQGYQAPEEANETTNETEEEELRGTFAYILGLNQDVMCEFEYADEANTSNGTVYIADLAERMRGDFNVENSAAGPMEAHVIRDGGYNYLWGSFSEDGIKVKVSEEEKDVLFSDNDQVDIDENTTFTCVTWSADESKFSLPEGVNFVELAPVGDQCAACDQAPAGAARDQCRAALKCQ